MRNINRCVFVLVAVIFITSISFAQEDVKIPKAPKVTGFSKVNSEDEKELLEKLSPELKAELLKVKELDQEKYEELLEETSYGSYDVYTGLMEPSEKERYEAEKKIEEWELRTEALGIRYEYASDNEKQKIVSDLKVVLNQLFDMKEKARSIEVEMLENELKQLKESLNTRKQSKNEIINRRLNELIGKGDDLDW